MTELKTDPGQSNDFANFYIAVRSVVYKICEQHWQPFENMGIKDL